MTTVTTATRPLNELAKSFEANTYARGGAVTVDTNYGETASAIWIGTAGDVILQGVDGVNHFFQNVANGTLLRFKHVQVPSAATISGTPRTTTATVMTWVGGEN